VKAPILWLQARSIWLPRGRMAWCVLLLLVLGVFGAIVVPALTQGIGTTVPGTPTVQFASGGYNCNWTDGCVTITVTLSSASSDTVTVQYATSDGTAIANQDYTPASGTVTFASGTTQQQISVAILSNGQTSPAFFTVTLSNPQNASVGTPATTTVTIGASGTIGSTATVSFDSSSWTYNESDGTATISATMTGTPTSAVSVDFGTSDGTGTAWVNYVPASGTLTWQPNQAGLSQTFTVTLIQQGQSTPTLTVNLTLSNPVNTSLAMPSTAVLNIMDCDGCP